MQHYPTVSEDGLLRSLESGDEKAFTEIFNRYWEKLLASAYYYMHDKHAAEDIVHEVLISLWTRRTGLQINSLNAYLATAVKFAVFKAIAREKKRKELLKENSLPEHFSDIEEKLDARFLNEYLQGAVEELPEKTKLVFAYSRYQALTISQIAGKMDLSPKAVEYHITKALKAIKDRLHKIKSFLF